MVAASAPAAAALASYSAFSASASARSLAASSSCSRMPAIFLSSALPIAAGTFFHSIMASTAIIASDTQAVASRPSAMGSAAAPWPSAAVEATASSPVWGSPSSPLVEAWARFSSTSTVFGSMVFTSAMGPNLDLKRRLHCLGCLGLGHIGPGEAGNHVLRRFGGDGLDIRHGGVGGLADAGLGRGDLFGRLGVGGLEIGRVHVCTPVTNAYLVCRLLLEKK